MKFSAFNSRIPFDERRDILFNAETEASALIPKEFVLSIDRLSIRMKSILTNLGMLVPRDCDEVSRVRQRYQEALRTENTLRLTINPTLNCNFNCWYCYETHKGKRQMSKSTSEAIQSFIRLNGHEYEKIVVSFFGGEPLIEFNTIIKPLALFLAKWSTDYRKSYEINFTTNGYLLTDDMISFLRDIHIGHFQLTLDGGPNSHNKVKKTDENNSFEVIKDNILKLAQVGFNVLLRINMTKDNAEESLLIPDFFKKTTLEIRNKICVTVQQVWQDYGCDILEYKWRLYEKFATMGILPYPQTFNRYMNLCYGDKPNSAVINYDGGLYKCTAIDFDKTKFHGNIADGNLNRLNKDFERYVQHKIYNINCNKCRILPICNGGCIKSWSQEDENYCRYKTEEQKDKLIITLLQEQILKERLAKKIIIRTKNNKQ